MATSSNGVGGLEQLVDELFVICMSEELSIEALQAKIKLLPSHTSSGAYEHLYSSRPFFHMACMNKNVTLEIIEYLLDVFPLIDNLPAAYFCLEGTTTSYALHCACYNNNCPDEVIKLLVKNNPVALNHFSLVGGGLSYDDDYVPGLPLHYYLAREKNVDIDTVKMLVEACPQTLGDMGDMADDMNVPPIIHVVISNENIKIDDLHGIITYFIQQSSQIMRVVDGMNSTPLHRVCMNGRPNLELFQLVFNAWPGAIRSRDNCAYLPIHDLCCNKQLDDTASLDILRFMLSVDPTVLRERNEEGYLPVDHAVLQKSYAFCKIIIDAYPESLTEDGSLPIHRACQFGSRDDTVDTIQYMLNLNPESINARDEDGCLPIHNAAEGGNVKAIELLLKHDPAAASKKTTGQWYNEQLPLHIACCADEEHVYTVQLLFDAYPEGILTPNGHGDTPIDIARMTPVTNSTNENTTVVLFLENQLAYAEKAREATLTTLDEGGWLPLHHALKSNVALGTIKLLLTGNPSAFWTADKKKLALPIHIACEFSSAKVVKYLVENYDSSVKCCDKNKDSILHYACRGGNLSVVKYLLETHAQLVSSATVNDKNELPIHLLCESRRGGGDSDSTEYIETIWLLLLANPEVLVA